MTKADLIARIDELVDGGAPWDGTRTVVLCPDHDSAPAVGRKLVQAPVLGCDKCLASVLQRFEHLRSTVATSFDAWDTRILPLLRDLRERLETAKDE